jgi:hypothetical protein
MLKLHTRRKLRRGNKMKKIKEALDLLKASQFYLSDVYKAVPECKQDHEKILSDAYKELEELKQNLRDSETDFLERDEYTDEPYYTCCQGLVENGGHRSNCWLNNIIKEEI